MTIGGFLYTGAPDGGIAYPFWMVSYLLHPLWIAGAGVALVVHRRQRTALVASPTAA